MDKCPSCNRVFQSILDYPLVKILEVSTIKPEQVPPIIKKQLGVDSIELNNAPLEVQAYFKMPAHIKIYPEIAQLTHSDGYVYELIVRQYYNPNLVVEKYCIKSQNLSCNAKQVLNENSELKAYLQSLETKVGKEMQPADLLPKWEQFGRFGWALAIPNSSGEYALALQGSDVTLYAKGLNLGRAGGPTLQKLCDVANIKYEGILLHR